MTMQKKQLSIRFALLLALCLMCAGGLCGCGSDALKTTEDKPSEQTAQTQESPDEQAKSTSSEPSENAEQTPKPTSSPQAADTAQSPAEAPAADMISVSIVVDASAVGRGCFAQATLSLEQGASVYDALCATGLPLGGSSSYVSSINGLAEFDFGGASGWKYSVNGQTPSIACGNYMLKAGDSISWYYTN